MLVIIGIMLLGIAVGWAARKQRITWIHRCINLLIWILLFLLGIDVGGNKAILYGLHTIGVEAAVITLFAVLGSTLFAWGLWHYLYHQKGEAKK